MLQFEDTSINSFMTPQELAVTDDTVPDSIMYLSITSSKQQKGLSASMCFAGCTGF